MNSDLQRTALVAGALGALLSVGLGAFAAHGLKAIIDPASLSTFQTGVEYQFYHSLGLILISAIAQSKSSVSLLWSVRLMLSGILLFSGSLYLLALTDISWIGPITPIGGLCFLGAWGCLAAHALRKQ